MAEPELVGEFPPGQDELPFIDEHTVTVTAAPEDVWDAVVSVASRFGSGRVSEAVARALGATPYRAGGQAGAVGATVPGFTVTRAHSPTELALEGRHRFSRYSLTFRIDHLPAGAARVRAETRAVFPGVTGAVYKALVIGSGGHVRAVRRMLGTIKRRAERS